MLYVNSEFYIKWYEICLFEEYSVGLILCCIFLEVEFIYFFYIFSYMIIKKKKRIILGCNFEMMGFKVLYFINKFKFIDKILCLRIVDKKVIF